MKRKDLEILGIEDGDVVDKIMALHGKAISRSQTDLETATSSIQTMQEQLEAANQTIENFKGMDIDAIKAAADDYKTKYEQAQKDAETQITQLKFEHALESSLSGAKAKNPKAVRALLDIGKLAMDEDGGITGLSEQLETIKIENDYLFVAEEPEPKIVTGGPKKSVITDSTVEVAREAAGLK